MSVFKVFYSAFRKVIGTANDRKIAKLRKIVRVINSFEGNLAKIDNQALAAKTLEFKERVAKGESLNSILPEAFAVVRETSKRVLKKRHFDVQLMGGIALHQGFLAEMGTGEGKTLVAALPAYLNALSGDPVYIITVNDYLAARDAEETGKIHSFLGLTTGCVTQNLRSKRRKAEYAKDIVYVTGKEMGFDYLRDNMKISLDDMVLRDLKYAIVDEVDSVLIDESRIPLIISGPSGDSSKIYKMVNSVIPRLDPTTDFVINLKQRSAELTEEGFNKAEEMLENLGLITSVKGLYDIEYLHLLHILRQALKAHTLFKKNIDYIVRNGEVVLINESTGRIAEGQRLSSGLHQAIEAKENVEVQEESQTIARITTQNFFRLFKKLSGMSGTVVSEGTEFNEIYKLDVVVIPPNLPRQRIDHHDRFFRSEEDKFQDLTRQVKLCHAKGQPVLIGTISIEKSEIVSQMLSAAGLEHNVLNAKFLEREARIIADAGKPGAITVATNMAGRGTDILLGGNLELMIQEFIADIEDETEKQKIIEKCQAKHKADCEKVLAAGGLFVIGSERYENRRIDNQLLGRTARQGDVGEAVFYLSLDDDIFRRTALNSPTNRQMVYNDLKPGEVYSKGAFDWIIKQAQKMFESQNFERRKDSFRYDEVLNDQRKIFYEERKLIMQQASVLEIVEDITQDFINGLFDAFVPVNKKPNWEPVKEALGKLVNLQEINLTIDRHNLLKNIKQNIIDQIEVKRSQKGQEEFDKAISAMMLQVIDHHWKTHLLNLDHLEHGMGLRSYGQKNPLNEYKEEAFKLFAAMLDNFRYDFLVKLRELDFAQVGEMKSQRDLESILEFLEGEGVSLDKMYRTNADQIGSFADGDFRDGKLPVDGPTSEMAKNPRKTTRLSPCICGSGKRYKDCCGKLDG